MMRASKEAFSRQIRRQESMTVPFLGTTLCSEKLSIRKGKAALTGGEEQKMGAGNTMGQDNLT